MRLLATSSPPVERPEEHPPLSRRPAQPPPGPDERSAQPPSAPDDRPATSSRTSEDNVIVLDEEITEAGAMHRVRSDALKLLSDLAR